MDQRTFTCISSIQAAPALSMATEYWLGGERVPHEGGTSKTARGEALRRQTDFHRIIYIFFPIFCSLVRCERLFLDTLEQE